MYNCKIRSSFKFYRPQIVFFDEKVIHMPSITRVHTLCIMISMYVDKESTTNLLFSPQNVSLRLKKKVVLKITVLLFFWDYYGDIWLKKQRSCDNEK